MGYDSASRLVKFIKLDLMALGEPGVNFIINSVRINGTICAVCKGDSAPWAERTSNGLKIKGFPVSGDADMPGLSFVHCYKHQHFRECRSEGQFIVTSFNTYLHSSQHACIW